MDDLERHTFLFADLAGFTALTEAMGDTDAADLANQFHADVSRIAAAYDAEVVKLIGDAAMVRANEAARAINLALEVVYDIGGQHLFPAVRVGINSGPAIARDGDWFGTTINVAARVSGVASGGEVLLTEATKVGARALAGVHLHERGRHDLKNVGEPVLLFAAVREGERDAAGLPIDPVCRMAVHPEHGAGRLNHGGVEFYFCSLKCAGIFAANPARYSGEVA